MSRRKKRLTEEEEQEVMEFIYQNNEEENKFLNSMTINVKSKTENHKPFTIFSAERETAVGFDSTSKTSSDETLLIKLEIGKFSG